MRDSILAKRVKVELPDSRHEYEEQTPTCSFRYDDGELDFMSLGVKPSIKQSSTPVQEATRAKISSLENQLDELTELRRAGRLDSERALQMRGLEDELKKARSKLRRLLSEAERQRKRRERMKHNSDLAQEQLLYAAGIIESASPTLQQEEDHIQIEHSKLLDSVRSCQNLDDLSSELHRFGFNLSRQTPFSEDSGLEEVKVHVELIEDDTITDIDTRNDLQNNSDDGQRNSQNSPTRDNEASPDDEDDSVPEEIKDKEPSLSYFAKLYAKKHMDHLKKWQSQYQEWYDKQVESQRLWEENFVRDQLEIAKGMMESVTATFMQGMQQIIQHLILSTQRPVYPLRPMGYDMNGCFMPRMARDFQNKQFSLRNKRLS